MCEANAFVLQTGKDPRLMMESVDVIEPEAEGLRLMNIFGEQKFIRARIHSVSLVEHKVYLEEIP